MHPQCEAVTENQKASKPLFHFWAFWGIIITTLSVMQYHAGCYTEEQFPLGQAGKYAYEDTETAKMSCW